MNRGEIRNHARVLADELTESPEGLFSNNQLNALINIAQNNVLLGIGVRIPRYLRSSSDITLTANKETYHVIDDLSITDLLLAADIQKNTTGKLQPPLPEIDLEDKWQYSGGVGNTDEPLVWGWEEKDTLFFTPIPNSAFPYRFYYFAELPALNHDDSDEGTNVATPRLPVISHPLISLDVMRMWGITDEEETEDIDRRYEIMEDRVCRLLSTQLAMKIKVKPGIKEYIAAKEY